MLAKKSKRNYEKASKFLWGSVAEALKALLMARKGFKIKSHSEFWDVARELSKNTVQGYLHSFP
jgi:hypothetical protein